MRYATWMSFCGRRVPQGRCAHAFSALVAHPTCLLLISSHAFRRLDAHQTDVLRVRLDEISYSEFRAALASGVPVQISGVHRRLQKHWTPNALMASIEDTVITCIECNSSKESRVTMPAKAFFDQLSPNAQPGAVYKVKVRDLDVCRDVLTTDFGLGLATRPPFQGCFSRTLPCLQPGFPRCLRRLRPR